MTIQSLASLLTLTLKGPAVWIMGIATWISAHGGLHHQGISRRLFAWGWVGQLRVTWGRVVQTGEAVA